MNQYVCMYVCIYDYFLSQLSKPGRALLSPLRYVGLRISYVSRLLYSFFDFYQRLIELCLELNLTKKKLNQIMWKIRQLL